MVSLKDDFTLFLLFISSLFYFGKKQRRSENFKEVRQNFPEVFNIDDVTSNVTSYRETNIAKKKNKLEFHSNH